MFWSVSSFSVISAGAVEYETAFLQMEKSPHQRVSWYDTKQSEGVASVILEIWGILSTPLLPLLQGLLWLPVVAYDRVLSMGRIELFDI